MKSDYLYLSDIHHQTTLLITACENISRQRFDADEFIRGGFIRCLEIIGEASKNISPEYREIHPEIPWKGMAGLRDKLIHGYGFVDTNQVWHIVSKLIPPLHAQLSEILTSENSC